MLTPEELILLHQKTQQALRLNPHWRIGQAYFNVLEEIRPDIADRVRSTEGIDPFYANEYLPAFFTEITTS